jgi:hypothetical protein
MDGMTVPPDTLQRQLRQLGDIVRTNTESIKLLAQAVKALNRQLEQLPPLPDNPNGGN